MLEARGPRRTMPSLLDAVRRTLPTAFAADLSESDLPCPWCGAATTEADDHCPCCRRRFG
jgi:rubrerythrin